MNQSLRNAPQSQYTAAPMRTLVVAPQPFFTPRGTPFSVYYRTLIMSEQGLEIDLLTYGQGQDVEVPGVNIIRIPGFSFLGNVKIGPSPLKAFLDIFMVLWTLALLIRHRYPLVHAHEEAVFFCRLFKPLFGYKLIYDMHSSLPQQLSNFGFTKSRLIHGLFARQEDLALTRADAVITICPHLAEYAVTKVADEQRHFLIENSIFEPVRLAGAKTASDAPEQLPPDITKLLQRERQGALVVYAGTLELYQGIDLLVGAMAQVVRQHPDTTLLVVGGTPAQVQRYEGQAREAGIGEHCWFTGNQPQHVATACTDRADILVSPRSRGTNTPLKVYQQLASGKPLVATNIYSHTQVLTDKVCVLVPPEPAGIAAGLVRLIDAPADAQALVAAAQRLYAQEYSRAAYTDKMQRLLGLLGHSPGG